MRRIAPFLIALPLLAAASAPVQPAGVSLDTELQQARAEQSAAAGPGAELVQSRQDLVGRRPQFAALEQRALQMTAASGGQALGAGDVAIAAGENVERLRGSESGNRTALALAAALAGENPATP